MFKYSKLSKKKYRKLFDCFVLGLPALQVAKHTGIHRNTVNRFFKKVRIRIAESERKRNGLLKGEIEIDESYFGGKKKGPRGRSSQNKQIVFGILERKGQVKTILVDDVSAETLMKEIVDHTEKGCVYYTDKFRSYNSLSRYGKHLRIDHAKEYVNSRHSHINGIEGFWSYAKKFLVKYNGVSKKNFYLYLKEIEWRFNNRRECNIKLKLQKLLSY
jgi:transposase-like protein